jgi:NAD(P)-dependent dehydrogenase (short-subunit alcohol dehydrogenase family)
MSTVNSGGKVLPTDRAVIVTGGSSGIGAAVVQQLADEGYRVAALSRSGRSIHSGVGQQDRVHHYTCDVGDTAQVIAVLDVVRQELGPVVGLVNSAGSYIRSPIEEADLADIERLIAVNLLGVINCCRAAVPFLRETGGSIVNIGSLLARRPIPATSVYAATKAGVEGFSRALAHELGPDGIRVNVVSPSIIDTPLYLRSGMPDDDYRSMLAERRAWFPLGRVGLPTDVAPLAAFLLSDGASWITGVNIPIDGGRSVS